jgi:hypothetical protein
MSKSLGILSITQSGPIMALSWKQPYGTAMLFGKIETRTWDIKYRGWMLICTSKQSYNLDVVRKISGNDLFVKICNVINNDPDKYSTLDLDGYAIGIGRLVDSRKMTLTDEEKCFVKYRPPWNEEKINKKTGKSKVVEKCLWCHIYENVHPVKPFPWKGSQGIRQVTPDQRKLIEII